MGARQRHNACPLALLPQVATQQLTTVDKELSERETTLRNREERLVQVEERMGTVGCNGVGA